MKTKITNLMINLETGERFELDAGETLETTVGELNALQADAEAANDEIELPPIPAGKSLVEHLVEQAVIPDGTPVFEVSSADDVHEIVNGYLEGLDKDKTIH